VRRSPLAEARTGRIAEARTGRIAAAAVATAIAAGSLAGAGSAGAGPGSRCAPRILLLSAFPGEIDPLLARADVREVVVTEGRAFYVGRLAGADVVLALSGIGLANADRTTRLALARFRCGAAPSIRAIVFSGVSGGRTFIGDVAIPERWTPDGGRTWYGVDPGMLAVVRDLARRNPPPLARRAPLGDPACVGTDPGLVRPVTLPHRPGVVVGGDGVSADPFGGRAWPCVPGGGDVFGCTPCRAPGGAPPDLPRLVRGVVPFVDPAFLLSFLRSPPPRASSAAAEDMETGAVARVAAAAHVPFIAFRSLSDGRGDPLHLPGFPFQFFVYRQLAADNAAAVALAFLEAWARP
jgi:nucleoside phosphorylase